MNKQSLSIVRKKFTVVQACNQNVKLRNMITLNIINQLSVLKICWPSTELTKSPQMAMMKRMETKSLARGTIMEAQSILIRISLAPAGFEPTLTLTTWLTGSMPYYYLSYKAHLPAPIRLYLIWINSTLIKAVKRPIGNIGSIQHSDLKCQLLHSSAVVWNVSLEEPAPIDDDDAVTHTHSKGG